MVQILISGIRCSTRHVQILWHVLCGWWVRTFVPEVSSWSHQHQARASLLFSQARRSMCPSSRGWCCHQLYHKIWLHTSLSGSSPHLGSHTWFKAGLGTRGTLWCIPMQPCRVFVPAKQWFISTQGYHFVLDHGTTGGLSCGHKMLSQLRGGLPQDGVIHQNLLHFVTYKSTEICQSIQYEMLLYTWEAGRQPESHYLQIIIYIRNEVKNKMALLGFPSFISPKNECIDTDVILKLHPQPIPPIRTHSRWFCI